MQPAPPQSSLPSHQVQSQQHIQQPTIPPNTDLQPQQHKCLSHLTLRSSFLQRYFKTSQVARQSLLLLHQHSNGLLVFGIDGQQLRRRGMVIVDVEDVIKGEVVRGKKKKGGTKVSQKTILCTLKLIESSNNQQHRIIIQSPINGWLLEVNQNIRQIGELILSGRSQEGWLCIVQRGARCDGNGPMKPVKDE